MLNAGYVDVADYANQGWLSGLKYEDEILDDLIKRTDSEEDKLKKVHRSASSLPLEAVNIEIVQLGVSECEFEGE